MSNVEDLFLELDPGGEIFPGSSLKNNPPSPDLLRTSLDPRETKRNVLAVYPDVEGLYSEFISGGMCKAGARAAGVSL